MVFSVNFQFLGSGLFSIEHRFFPDLLLNYITVAKLDIFLKKKKNTTTTISLDVELVFNLAT